MLHETLEYLGIAFVSSALLIVLSKIILQALIRRPADYYNAAELEQEELMLNAGGISITSEHETNPEGEILKETHLEAHLGDSPAAEPEEIIAEIPEAVTESITVMPCAEEPAESESGETEPEVSEPEVPELKEPESEMPDPEEPKTEVPEPEVPKSEEPASEEPEPEEPESGEPETEMPETEVPEPEVSGSGAPELPAAVSENTAPKTPEEQFGFSIKARTSRTRKPEKKEDAASEGTEQTGSDPEHEVPQDNAVWTESYSEISASLAKAFEERQSSDDSAADGVTEQKSAGSHTGESGIRHGSEGKRKKSSRRKPSMNMNRKELVRIAESHGIEVPEDATKRDILGLIYSDHRKRY